MHRYLVIIEKANDNYSAFSPDVPGCVATGATREEAEREMHAALQMHLDGLKEDGLPVPAPSASVRYIEA
jgi:predicted RNase H-like HicB family nuclease